MKKFWFLPLIMVLSLFAQAQVSAPLKKVFSLDPQSYEAGNGACVVWHPLLKKYYSARAGNKEYPLDIFDAKGKRLSEDGLQTRFDMRGMWFDPIKKRICMNGYYESGWASYKLDGSGLPSDVEWIAEGMNQPSENSFGCFDGMKSRVYFLAGTGIFAYYAHNAMKVNESEILNLADGIGKAYGLELDMDEELPEFYNPVMIYTGLPNQEFGLLNHEQKTIDLFSAKSGLRTKVLKLPETAEPTSMFNFCYTNGTYFLYHKNVGIWVGYK